MDQKKSFIPQFAELPTLNCRLPGIAEATIAPCSLQKLCVDVICFHAQAVCKKVICTSDADETGIDDFVGLRLPIHQISLPESVCEELLEAFVNHRLLNDENFQIFGHHAHLDVVDIMHSPLTLKGLQVLQKHTVSELRLKNIDTKLDKIISSTVINPPTEKALRVLSLTNLTFTEHTNEKMRHSTHMSTMSDLAAAFTNLVSLSLVNVDLQNHGLKALCEKLSPTVSALDISDNPITDITPLRLLANSLRNLLMYNICRLPESNLKVLMTDLHELRHLDISRFADQQFDFVLLANSYQLDIEKLLSPTQESFKLLVSLDVSGWKELKTNVIRRFLHCHKSIIFIGLAMVDASEAEVFQDPSNSLYIHHLSVGMLIGEQKVLESCCRYKSRPFVQKCLLALFQLTKQCDKPRPDLIHMLIDLMALHTDHASVLMAATACLYNLTKNELVHSLHTEYLKLVVQAIMDCMQKYPCTEALQRNCLLTICSDRVLGEVTFDRYKCIELALECLCKFKDPATTRMCLAVTSILAAKVPIDAISDLAANNKYMLRLIEITSSKANVLATDCVMRFALSALWNLTDESPKACQCFFKLQGLDLAVECLSKYSAVADEEERLQIQIKIVGLLNNIAEVDDLRLNLINAAFLEVIRESLRSPNNEYAYFSGGILANLLCNLKNPAWSNIDSTKLEHIQEEMISVISEWKQPDTAMVAYRCFRVFCPLLSPSAPASTQYWALWAIDHVCRRDRSKYVEMIHSGRVYDDVRRIVKRGSPCKQVSELAQSLYEFVGEPPSPPSLPSRS